MLLNSVSALRSSSIVPLCNSSSSSKLGMENTYVIVDQSLAKCFCKFNLVMGKFLLLLLFTLLVVTLQYFGGYGYHGMSFEQKYRCYPASFIDKPQIESGGKIIMPPSALDRLASLHIDYPMLFELSNPAAQRVSHCGVLEFIAEEGMIYMPYWVSFTTADVSRALIPVVILLIVSCQMMENMLLQEGDTVQEKVGKVSLDVHQYFMLLQERGILKLKMPHKGMDVLNIEAAAVLDGFFPTPSLETTLRNFSCLTTGDSIMVAYNNKKYYIDIVETKPSNAISIIETDCEVDFAPPLDYKEPEKPVAPVPLGKAAAEVLDSNPAIDDTLNLLGAGCCWTVDTPRFGYPSSKTNCLSLFSVQEAPVEPEPKFNPFCGVGRRLDGKPQKYEPPPVSSSGSKDKRPVNRGSGQPSAGSSSQSSSRQSQGKLVFGSNVNRSPKETQKEAAKATKQEEPKKEEPKFQPFSGKKYSLKG
ncbi:Ubiquitin recognition factor in ER-associated degradation protein 1 [Vitis vinifera]|uniref:Ubiquitin recognition factor in ER-associated degradation protein 1 n=1 Tax=Vitis vinifera TaxID=29760 RepID=A0A438I9R5_VITVI|nr:Ubiquitin recognition factor in ER-associated degradation protein 1 [Vitis vinifera]